MSHAEAHVDFDRLVDLAEGRLAQTEVVSTRAHLSTCAICGTQLAWVERVIGLMREDAATSTFEEPPSHVVARAQRLLRQVAPANGPEPHERTRVARTLANLLFDSSSAPPAAAGVRSLSDAGRQ